jgi:hypothetical protein
VERRALTLALRESMRPSRAFERRRLVAPAAAHRLEASVTGRVPPDSGQSHLAAVGQLSTFPRLAQFIRCVSPAGRG